MSFLNWAIDMGQSADIDRLNKQIEKHEETIEDIKKILHQMALRIVELEKNKHDEIPSHPIGNSNDSIL